MVIVMLVDDNYDAGDPICVINQLLPVSTLTVLWFSKVFLL